MQATGNFLLMKRLLTHNVRAAVDREAVAAGYPATTPDQLLMAMEMMVQYVLKQVGETYAPPPVAGMQVPRLVGDVEIDTKV
jgi:hypothetical protein